MISEYFDIEALVARPREQMTGSMWAERYRVLTSVTSSVTGPWQSSLFKVSEGVLNAVTNDNVAEVAWCSGTQNSKTETILNALGYLIHQTPAPVMVVYPEKDDCKSMSDIRVADMIDNARDGILVKRIEMTDRRRNVFSVPFVGGILSFAWATNVNKLASKPVKYIFLDEIDKYQNIKGHGSPLALVRERQKAFPHSKIFMASSPTYEEGAIWQAVSESDYVFKYHTPCPHCDSSIIFNYEQVRQSDDNIAYYECPCCAEAIHNKDKNNMLANGNWLTLDGVTLDEVLQTGSKLHLGFFSSSFHSPFISFTDIYKKYEQTKDNPEEFKVFVNGWLGQPYDDSLTGMEHVADELLARVESYEKVPAEVLRITAGVDIQKDRIEVLVKGWGKGRENWDIDKRVLYGDPTQPIVWDELLELINTVYDTDDNRRLLIACTAIDSGYLAHEVYEFCLKYKRLNVFAVKGSSRRDAPAIAAPTRVGRNKNVKLFSMGVHGLKTTVYHMLAQTEIGAGYMHFKESICDKAYFEQLTAEKLVAYVERGKRYETWEKVRDRNEVLDMTIYNLVALYILGTKL